MEIFLFLCFCSSSISQLSISAFDHRKFLKGQLVAESSLLGSAGSKAPIAAETLDRSAFNENW